MGEGLVAVPALVSTCCPDTQIRLGLTFWKAMSSGLSIPWEPTSKISCTSGQRTVQAGAARRFDSLWCLPRRSRARPPLFPHSTGGEGLGCPRWPWGSPALGGEWGPELVPHLGSSCGGSSAVELGMCQTPEFGVMEAELCLQMELLARPLGAGKGVE